MTATKTGLFAASAILVFASVANAADPIVPAPVTPATPVASTAHDWTGFYAGINAGYGFGEQVDADGNILNPFNRVDGLTGGAQIGANAQFGMFVLGVEGDIQVSGMSQTEIIGGSNVQVALDYFGTVRARAGVAVDSFMPYLTGGLAYGGATIDDVGFDSDSNTHWGWTIGGGVEFAMDDSVSFKGEYLYTDLGAEEYFGGGVDAGLRFHTVRAGVNFHF